MPPNASVGSMAIPQEEQEVVLAAASRTKTRRRSSTLKMKRLFDAASRRTKKNGAASKAASASATTVEHACGDGTITTDKYGFMLEDEQCMATAAGGGGGSKGDAKRWESLLDSAPPRQQDASVLSRTRLKYYARRGLPDALRQKAWMVLPGVDVVMQKNQKPRKYNALLQRAEREYRKMKHLERAGDTARISRVGNLLDTIERDICRTFPRHYLFRTESAEDEPSPHGDGGKPDGGRDMHGDLESSGSEDEDARDVADAARAPPATGKEAAVALAAKKRQFSASIQSLQQSLYDGTEDDAPMPEHLGRNKDGAKGAKKAASRGSEKVTVGHGQGALRNVLRAYCIYDSETGYCQGMNFIAAMFLTFLPEEASFWLLVQCMHREPHALRHMFGEDMSGTHEMLYVAEKLLDRFLPALARHLEAQGIHVSMLVTEWLVTLYVRTFPFDLVTRVWDCFLVEGWKVIYRVMLSLLKHAAQDVLDLEFEQILHYFKELPSKVNGQAIMTGSLKLALKSKHIRQYADEWRRQTAGG